MPGKGSKPPNGKVSMIQNQKTCLAHGISQLVQHHATLNLLQQDCSLLALYIVFNKEISNQIVQIF